MKNKNPKFCDECRKESCSNCDKMSAYVEGLNDGIDEVLLMIINKHGKRIKNLLQDMN